MFISPSMRSSSTAEVAEIFIGPRLVVGLPCLTYRDRFDVDANITNGHIETDWAPRYPRTRFALPSLRCFIRNRSSNDSMTPIGRALTPEGSACELDVCVAPLGAQAESVACASPLRRCRWTRCCRRGPHSSKSCPGTGNVSPSANSMYIVDIGIRETGCERAALAGTCSKRGSGRGRVVYPQPASAGRPCLRHR